MSDASPSRAEVARDAKGSRRSEASNPRRPISLWVAIVAILLAAVVVGAARSAKAADVKTEAEDMTRSGDVVVKHTDVSASGGQDVAYYTGGSATATFSGDLTRVNLRARENYCEGHAKLRVYVDGFDKGTITLTSSTFGNYPFNVSGIGSGSHEIRISFVNDKMTARCDRNAYLDYVTLTTTDTPTDTTAPTVDPTTTPADGATNVALGTTIEASFSEGMDQSTINQGTFTLLKQGTTTPVSASVSYVAAPTYQATLTPSNALDPGTTYTATIEGGTSGVKDIAGNPLATDKTWSFTTADPPPPPPTDTDGDGVADGVDKCPTQAGPSSNNGCPVVSSSSNPFAGQKFYVNPNSNAKKTEDQWRAAGRIADADQMDKIARNPDIFYFSEWTQNAPGGTAAHVDWQTDQIYAQGALPVYGLYAVPHRDCGAYSSGGFTTADQYRGWVNDVISGLQGRKAVFVVEPDGLASTDCLSSTQLQERFDLIHYAVNQIEGEGSAAYIDASNCFAPDSFIINRLKLAGIADAHGFSRNVSNFCYTSSEIQHGTTISDAVGGKHFIIDTSRNGLGPYQDANNWCNPPGRALGAQPTADTGNKLVDAYYWLKRPGESDGSCNGYPGAGTWMPDYALGLAQRASW